MASRADAYRALFERISRLPGLVTASRRLRIWNVVPPKEQPALFMALGGQIPAQVRGLPTVWTLEAVVWIYARRDASDDAAEDKGADALCDLVDAVTEALRRRADEVVAPDAAQQPDVPDVTTLGGLVEWARVEGPVQTDEGTEGDQAVARLSIHMRWIKS